MKGRLFPVLLAVVLGGCAQPPTARLQTQAVADAGVKLEPALDLVFGVLDQKSTATDAMAKASMAPVEDGVLDPRLAPLRRRMEQRLGEIDALKQSRAVGENNRGYLEVRGTVTPDDEQVISDENADRRDAYAIIAALFKDAIEQVGRLRAQTIALRLGRDVWRQGHDGVWHQE